jgi:hypothetical protein
MTDPEGWTKTADVYLQYVHASTLLYAKQAVDFANLPSKSGL